MQKVFLDRKPWKLKNKANFKWIFAFENVHIKGEIISKTLLTSNENYVEVNKKDAEKYLLFIARYVIGGVVNVNEVCILF